jgi:hypothetical protein
MCKAFSSIVVMSGEVYCDPALTDSHEVLKRAHCPQLPDDGIAFVRVEYTPPDDPSEIGDLDCWHLILDAVAAPVWWEDREESVRTTMRRLVERMLVSGTRDILLGGCWILLGGACVRDVYFSRILSMHGRSQVRALYDSSRVGALYGSSQVGALYGSSQVGTLYDSSRVGTLYDSSQVGTLYGSSRVCALYGSSRVVKDLRCSE